MSANLKIELIGRMFEAQTVNVNTVFGGVAMEWKISVPRWELKQLFDPSEIPAHISNVELTINGGSVARGNVVILLTPHPCGFNVEPATVHFYESEWITAEDPSSEAPGGQS